MSNVVSRLTDLLDRLLDQALERSARASARRFGRRSALAQIGGALVGGAAVAVLPFNRAFGQDEEGAVDDETSCEYWRYCAIDGYLCADSGGSASSCPAGSQASAVAWVGTCQNPGDGAEYLISYADCCGKPYYNGATFCLSNQGERPGYQMGLHNDINWCMANESTGYHCTVAYVLGPA